MAVDRRVVMSTLTAYVDIDSVLLAFALLQQLLSLLINPGRRSEVRSRALAPMCLCPGGSGSCARQGTLI